MCKSTRMKCVSSSGPVSGMINQDHKMDLDLYPGMAQVAFVMVRARKGFSERALYRGTAALWHVY
jgi:hypothetical protein